MLERQDFLIFLGDRHGPPKVAQDRTDKGVLSEAHLAGSHHGERPSSQDTVTQGVCVGKSSRKKEDVSV